MFSLNILLCGDLPNTIVVSVTDPAKWTVDNLKQLVIKDVPKATKSDITFSFCKNKLPEGVPLKECDGVKNGTGLLTSIKPFIIKVMLMVPLLLKYLYLSLMTGRSALF